MKKISIDLSTLSGWQPLTYDEHSFIIKAKASGYQDSDDSEIFKITKQLPSGGETWVFNNGNLSDYEFKDFTVNFTCNGVRYTQMWNGDPDYGDWNFSGNGHNVTVTGNNYYGPYILDEYRTIILDNPAEGELLTWLQTNATKQEPSTGYKITLYAGDLDAIASDGATKIKINSRPTTESDYDYRTNEPSETNWGRQGYLYDKNGRVANPTIVENVSKVYIFAASDLGYGYAGEYSINDGEIVRVETLSENIAEIDITSDTKITIYPVED